MYMEKNGKRQGPLTRELKVFDAQHAVCPTHSPLCRRQSPEIQQTERQYHLSFNLLCLLVVEGKTQLLHLTEVILNVHVDGLSIC